MHGQEAANWIAHSKPTIDAPDLEEVAAVLRSGHLARGPLVHDFERAVAARLGVAGGVALSSGSAALTCALCALGIQDSDEVVVPSYVCSDVWHAIRAAGAAPVLCDVGDDWCLTAESVASCLTNRTRAIIAVHVFGIAAELAPIRGLGVPVIEDCCQAMGAEDDARKTGGLGEACAVSFHATKLLTTGEGGMVLSRDPDIVGRLRRLTQADPRLRGIRPILSDLQAALGLSQLRRYDEFLLRRAAIADRYFTELGSTSVRLPEHVRRRSIFFRFPVRTRLAFDTVQAEFAADRIHVRRGVDRLLHEQFEHRHNRYPRSESCFEETVCLPIYPSLTDADQGRVIETARRVFP